MSPALKAKIADEIAKLRKDIADLKAIEVRESVMRRLNLGGGGVAIGIPFNLAHYPLKGSAADVAPVIHGG
jgi:hypothetical protein